MPNRLADEASPYLQQHAKNPVDWYPWGDEALTRAKKEDKPILLSIGYSACHWCHVMEHESFENEDIAKQMNASFVCIKVDREERPDLDQIYQLVVQLLGRSGGWPLTVFLTPEQKPFFGGTYFPPIERYGMPGFPRILQAITEAYRDRRDDIDAQAKEIAGAIAQVAKPDGRKVDLGPELLGQGAVRLAARFDDEHGGFGSRPKFPNTMCLDLMLRHGTLAKDERSRARVKKALDSMRAGGIYDQLGGGFHRYSTDERWLVPHFEKMLYDNALLLRMYVDGHRAFGEERFAATAREIVGYVLREMTDASGGFYSTQDADSEGHEGKFFVWSRDEVRAACGDDAELACARFGVDDAGNFEDTGKTVLFQAKSIQDIAVRFTLAPSEVERRLESARTQMLASREKRIKPFRDEKILASWNGLFISALADAARALEEPTWLAAAERAFDFIVKTLIKDGRVLRHSKDGVAKGPGFLDDQAFVGCAALDLYETTGKTEYLDHARALATGIREHFTDDAGELYLVARDGEPLIARPQDVFDHAIPSATSMALALFVRLGDDYLAFAEPRLAALASAAVENPFGLSQTLMLVDRVVRSSTDVHLTGESSDHLRATFGSYIPHRGVFWEKEKMIQKPSAFVCIGRSCSLPVSGYRELVGLLSPSGDATVPAN